MVEIILGDVQIDPMEDLIDLKLLLEPVKEKMAAVKSLQNCGEVGEQYASFHIEEMLLELLSQVKNMYIEYALAQEDATKDAVVSALWDYFLSQGKNEVTCSDMLEPLEEVYFKKIISLKVLKEYNKENNND